MITRGGEPSFVSSQGRSHWIPAYAPNNLLDSTGCGDTYVAGYLFHRQRTRHLDEVGKFAAIAATLKLEQYGPFTGSDQAIREFAAAAGNRIPALK